MPTNYYRSFCFLDNNTGNIEIWGGYSTNPNTKWVLSSIYELEGQLSTLERNTKYFITEDKKQFSSELNKSSKRSNINITILKH